jgi:signal transduction histidine kinase
MNFALSFVFVLSYYLVMVLPLLILTNYLVGLNLHKPFFPFYKELSAVTMYENIITALFCSVYFMNYKIRIELSKLKISLEQTVSDRTRHLNSTILKLKETQNYLVLSEKMAALSTLTSGVAHEINNPLNFISGGEQLIKEYCQQGNQ